MYEENKVFKFVIKIIFSVIFCFFFWGVKGYATDEADLLALYQKAKQEGRVVYYTGAGIESAQEFVKKFGEKYPGIKVDIYRAAAPFILNRIMAEDKAGKHTFDVVQISAPMFHQLVLRKLIGKYKLSSDSFYQKGFRDHGGYWTGFYVIPLPISFNTKLVKRSEVPLTWEGLLDQKWKGKMGMDNTQYDWPSGILDSMGEEKGIKYFRALALQKITYRSGGTLLAQLMAAGETSMTVYGNLRSIENLKNQGAPVDWIRMKSPIPATLSVIGIGEYSTHPNAARLFYEFICSKEGQEIIAKNNYLSPRSDIDTPLQKDFKQLDVIPAMPMGEADLRKISTTFRSIFK